MRNAFVLGIAVLVTTGLVLAQDHSNSTEKAVKADVSFRSDVRIGTTTLKAGAYRIACDRETVTFSPLEGGKSLKMPCKGAQLSAPSKRTESHLARDASGVQFLEKLLLKGSSIEHTFD